MNLSMKKIMVIIAIVFVAIAVVLYFIFGMKKSPQQTATVQGNTGQTIPSLPEAQTAVSPDLNAVKKSTQDELTNAQNAGSNISQKNYNDPSGKIISLNDFAKANGIKIGEGVLGDSSQKDYETFSCANRGKNQPKIGIMLQLRRDVDPKQYQQLFPDMENNMKTWEKTIFQDLGPLFFPGESFNKEPVFGAVKYTTSNKANIVEIRFANLEAVSGNQYSIDWGFLNDQVFFSDDKDCLRQELDKNADAYEP